MEGLLGEISNFLNSQFNSEWKIGSGFSDNQSSSVYKLLNTLAKQLSPPKEINQLSVDEILQFMSEQFDEKLFIVRERFRFWTETKRQPGRVCKI